MGYATPLHGRDSGGEPDLLPHVDMTCQHGVDPDVDENHECDPEQRPISMRLAHDIARHLSAAGYTDDDAITRQVLCLAEETGEFVGAYRRWAGLARRSGTAEERDAELADVVITAYVTAAVLGIDLDAAISSKLDVIFKRGWRERAAIKPTDAANTERVARAIFDADEWKPGWREVYLVRARAALVAMAATS